MSSQIGYIIYLANATNKANIIHRYSIKCKRVTRNVLTANLYRIAYGFDIRTVTQATQRKIIRSAIAQLLCTDSKFLYQCLVQFAISQNKQLMVYAMSLQQINEQRQITKGKCIYEYHNPANSMIKTNSLSPLKTLMETKCINISPIKWVERESIQ